MSAVKAPVGVLSTPPAGATSHAPRGVHSLWAELLIASALSPGAWVAGRLREAVMRLHQQRALVLQSSRWLWMHPGHHECHPAQDISGCQSA
eukprot:15456547-Alexandrium_andersonii.AAC.1